MAHYPIEEAGQFVGPLGMRPERRLPPWIKVRFPSGEGYLRMDRLLRGERLHTVCQEARCPNIGECFNNGTATFLILGNVCTRNCRFCAVQSGCPGPLDWVEAERVAQAVRSLGLRYAVITSVTRDDLEDGGAAIFALTVEKIRGAVPTCQVEVLIPDLNGSWEALAKVVRARPKVLNHNLETVPRLYPKVRPRAAYHRSLDLLRRAKELDGGILTKSGLILGLGETHQEVMETMGDLRQVGCDLLTLGQYLRPSLKHLPVYRFYAPQEFGELASLGRELGFRHVEAGPLVRSSYHAHRQIADQSDT